MNIDELLPFYALDVVSVEERAFVEAELLKRPDLQATLAEYLVGADAISLSVEPVMPSESTRFDLMARVATTPRAKKHAAIAQPSVAPPRLNAQSADTWWQRLIRTWRTPTVAVGFALAAVALIWAFTLQSNLNNARQQVADLQQNLTAEQLALSEQSADNATLTTANEQMATANGALVTDNERLTSENSALTETNAQLSADNDALAALNDQLITENSALSQTNDLLTSNNANLESENASLTVTNEQLVVTQLQNSELFEIMAVTNARWFDVAGTEAEETAQGQLVVDFELDQAVFLVSGLPQLAPRETYQLWLSSEDEVVSAGLITVDENGLGQLSLPEAPAERFTGVGVSIEPAGGSDQPTGPIVMNADL